MIRLNDILQRVASYHPDPDLDIIKKAYVYSAKVHQGQLRNSGEPYLIHPLEVAGILAQLRLDEASIVTGLLHDTIEDTLATAEELTELFGPEISQLVDGVTKLSKFSASAALSQEEKQAENFRKMIIAMAQDIRVILVKLADRTHNMRTLQHMPEEKQQRIARETLDIYAPLANRLGISWIKTELEDLSLRYLKPQEYFDLLEKLNRRRKEREQYIEQVVRLIEGKLKERELEGRVSGRFKHVYSLYKKIRAQGIEFDQVHDVIGFRLIMPTVPSCYEALGLIHQLWKPVPGRFKDFIAIPKPNMYQSLHTAVIGPMGERMEVQIRTEEMHKIAEEGIAAHWAYKEGKSLISKDDEKFAWLRQLMEWQQDLKDPKEFLETVKVDLFSDEVFVFTPKGDVKSLPRGATPVDFAYAVHTSLGHRCRGAKVDGAMVPLNHALASGQRVEIVTVKQGGPSRDWLNAELGYVVSHRARAKVRQWFKAQQVEETIAHGREIVERELARAGLTAVKLEALAADTGYAKLDEFFAAVARTEINLRALQTAMHAVARPDAASPAPAETEAVVTRQSRAAGAGSGILIVGVDRLMTGLARCCKPAPPDPIVGFVTRGKGISIHRQSCSNVARMKERQPERLITADWGTPRDEVFAVDVIVEAMDRQGLLRDVTEVFSREKINVTAVNTLTRNLQARMAFTLEVRGLDELKRALLLVREVSGVLSVARR